MTCSFIIRSMLCAAAGLLSAASLSQAQTDSLAAWLIRQAGHTNGIACIARCGDGALPVALARRSNLLVVGLDQSDANVAAARNAANGAGLLNRRIYIDRGDPSTTLPLADNFVDLLAITNVSNGDLASLSPGEILRALAPYHGVAIIGNSGSGLTQTALQTWANTLGVAGVQIVSNTNGLYAVITKPPLVGSDNWTHRFHAADGNPTSQDTALKFPYMTQWMGKTYYEVDAGSEVVVANGRMYVMERSPMSNCQFEFFRSVLFYARNVYNGQTLWRRYLPLKYITGHGAMAAYGDTLLVMVGDKVACIDGETGAELGRISFAGLQGHVKKVMVLNSILVVLAGGRDMSTDFTDSNASWSPTVWNVTYPTDSLGLLQAYGNEIAAYNLSTGRTLWRDSTAGIDITMIGARDGRVYYYADKSAAVALDINTGSQVWQNNTSQLTGALTSTGHGHSGNGLSICGPAMVIGDKESGNIACLSTQDGSVVWTKACPSANGTPIALVHDSMYTYGGVTSLANSGVRTMNWPHGGCGVFTAGDEMLYSQTGLGWNLKTNTSMVGGDSYIVKGPCDMADFSADGLWIKQAHLCGCEVVTNGTKVMGSAGSFIFNRVAVESERLTRGDTTVASPLAPDGNDWFAYRGNVQHTGSTRVSVATAGVHQMFEYTPDVLYQQVPDVPKWSDRVSTNNVTLYTVDQHTTHPITVGHYCFFGATDGKVRCIDIQTGSLAWVFTAGGELRDPPAVWNGRLYFGCGDGYVYALEATTGRQLWRFRAAPTERRVMVYGQLMSTWPILGTVVVQDGVVYAAAGFNAEDGTHVYALNAVNGSIKWQNDSLGHQPSQYQYGRNVNTGFTIAGGRLMMRSGRKATTTLDLQTGRLVPGHVDSMAANQAQGGVSSRLAVYHNFVMYGGRRLVSDHWERGGYKLDILRNYWFCELDADGMPLYPEVSPFPDLSGATSICAYGVPAWDSITFVAFYNHIFSCLNASQLDSCLTQTRMAHPGVATMVRATPPPPRWQKAVGCYVNAMAVTANAVVYTWTSDAYDPTTPNWKVSAVSKQTGDSLWTLPLPVEPLYDGMCVDRNGSVIVALRDGRIRCYGVGSVSVAGGEAPMPQFREPAAPAVVAGSAFSAARAENALPATSSTRAANTRPDDQPVQAAHAVPGPMPAASPIPSPADLGMQAFLSGSDEGWASRAQHHGGYGSLAQPQESSYRPRDMHWYCSRACLTIATVRASSSSGRNVAANTLDRDLATRWATGQPGPQWISFDLGTAREISGVTMVWYGAQKTDAVLRIATSLDGVSFAEVESAPLEGHGTRTSLRTFVPQSARWVRLALQPTDGHPCPSVYEVGIHGEASEREASAR